MDNNKDKTENENDKQDIFKNNRIIFNKGFLIIMLDSFNADFIYYEHKEVKRKKFINIIYKSPTIYLNGLTFETPWMKVNKNSYKILNNNSKIWIEQTFIGYKEDSEINLFLQVMNNIDMNAINYINSYKNYLELDNNYNNFEKSNSYNDNEISNEDYDNVDNSVDTILINKKGEDLFCKNVKVNQDDNSDDDDNNIKNNYFYIKNKADIYLKNITLNNEKYDGDINDIKLKNCSIKTIITCGGLWKYNNKCGMSWKIIKMNIVSPESNNIFNKTANLSLIKKIPNFELQFDPEYMNKINKIR